MTGARCAGDRGPALIFVHGVGSTGAIWDRQLDAFGGEYRCVSIELRGNGVLKDPQPSAITRAGYATDVLAVADRLGIERFTLVGCSLGGVVAFELWTRAPRTFRRDGRSRQLRAISRCPELCCRRHGSSAGGREHAPFCARAGREVGTNAERLAETIEQMACKSVPCYLAATQATWTGDYRSILPSIAVPALVACGDRDTIAPRGLSEEIAAGIPNAKLAVVENAGHVANADNAASFDGLLRDFLMRLRLL